MHQVFAIFLRDVKRILKNPVALVVTLGVAIIPSLYAWCNILANWDPYANTGNIQVAVANEDKGTTSTLVGHLDAGQQTVNQLKKNHQLGWRFVPKQQAIEGVESGKYYAAIVLPEDFSSRLIGTVTGKGDRPSITYYINEKLNAIAPKITDTGATTIDEQINTTFVSSVADAVAKEVKEAAGETTGSVKNAQSDVDQRSDRHHQPARNRPTAAARHPLPRSTRPSPPSIRPNSPTSRSPRKSPTRLTPSARRPTC